MGVFSLWRNLRHRARVERDLDDEVHAMFELLVREKVRDGMSTDEARRAARLELGDVESVKQQVREVRAGAFADTLVQDLRYGGRLLRRSPLFTLTAAMSLAVGIGATTAIFTVANGLLLRSAPGVADPGTLVDVVRLREGDTGVDPVPYQDYLELRRRATTVDDVHAYQLDLEAASLRVTDSAERVFVNVVSSNYFDALGVQAAIGRMFEPGDGEELGSSPLLVISHRFWTRRFNADPGVVGTEVWLNAVPFTVVGVADERFRGTSVVAPDAWVPISMVTSLQPESGSFRLTNRASAWLMVGARLRPGVSRSQASAEIASIGAQLDREFPIAPEFLPPGMPPPVFRWSAETASPIPYGMRLVAAAFLGLLIALVSVVLVIACANVAGILLARAAVRRREIAVRSAIGAGRARIVRQLLTETMLLFALGAAAGLAVARVMTTGLLAALPALPLPVNVAVPLDGRVVAFSLAVSLVAAVLSGLAPALQVSKADIIGSLKDDARGPSERLRLRNAFVAAQVAFSVLLVVVAATLARGFERLASVDRGFVARDVDVASVDLSMAGYTVATGRLFADALIERVRRMPGVQDATLANRPPSLNSMSFGGVTVPGLTPPDGRFFYLSWTLVESGYFATLRIPLMAGRDFDDRDRDGSEPVAIVGEAVARRFWPGKDAIGQSLLVHRSNPGTPDAPPPTPLRVVGVARDLTTGRNSRFPTPLALYVPWHQQYSPQLSVLARTGPGGGTAGALRTLITSIDPNLPVLSAQALESQLDGPVEMQVRIGASVAASVGVIGLLLAAIGLYGVTAYTVTQKTHEIGVRLSLGAGSRAVVSLVLRQTMVLVGAGSAAGLALGAAAGGLIAGTYGVPAPDASVLGAAAALFATVALIASFVPVRRALRINAMDAVRYE